MRQLRYMADTYEGTPRVAMADYADAGRSIIALKATEGSHHGDSKHRQRAIEAHDRGLAVVHYHYAHPGSDATPISEVHNFVVHVSPVFKPYDYLALDVEEPSSFAMMNTAQWCDAWIYAARNIFQHTPIVYASESFINTYLRPLHIPGERFWVAKYGPGYPVLPDGKKVWAWQYTDGGAGLEPHTAPGIGRGDNSILPLPLATALAARAWRRRRGLAHK